MRRFYVKDAAKELGISLSLLYALLYERKIRHERHGMGRGRYVITEESLEEYRKTREVTPIVGEAKRKFVHVKLP